MELSEEAACICRTALFATARLEEKRYAKQFKMPLSPVDLSECGDIHCIDALNFDWDKIFDGADWFHFTGITPALGDNVAAICLEACKAAKAKGITVSCDLNYRNKLWSKEKAGQVMGELCKYVDVCISNEEDANDVFGIKSEGTEVTAGELNKEGYKEVAQKLTDRFGFKKLQSH